jgi:hypothetical protein
MGPAMRCLVSMDEKVQEMVRKYQEIVCKYAEIGGLMSMLLHKGFLGMFRYVLEIP